MKLEQTPRSRAVSVNVNLGQHDAALRQVWRGLLQTLEVLVTAFRVLSMAEHSFTSLSAIVTREGSRLSLHNV